MITIAAAPDREQQEYLLSMYASRAAENLEEILLRAEQHIAVLQAALANVGPSHPSEQDRLDWLMYKLERAVRLFEDDRGRIAQRAIDQGILDVEGDRREVPALPAVAP